MPGRRTAGPQAAPVQPAARRAGPPAARHAAQPAVPGAMTVSVVPAPSSEDFDAERVREQFYEVLQKYPPALGRVLKLDPSLIANDAYLAPAPGWLAA